MNIKGMRALGRDIRRPLHFEVSIPEVPYQSFQSILVSCVLEPIYLKLQHLPILDKFGEISPLATLVVTFDSKQIHAHLPT